MNVRNSIGEIENPSSIISSDWWDPSWDSCTRIDIENYNDDIFNHQILVNFSDSIFDYSKCQDNGEDIRFIDKSNLTELSYWIEKWDPLGDSRIWIKLPYLKGYDNTTIFMYYENPVASESSDGDATFVFYTDYTELNQWTITGSQLSISVIGTDLRFLQNAAVGEDAKISCVCTLTNYIYEERIKIKNDVPGNSHLFFAFLDHTDIALWGGFRQVWDNEDATFYQTPTANNLLYDGFSHNLYYNRREIINDVTKQASYYFFNDNFSGAPLASALNKPFITDDLDTLEKIMIFTGTGSSRDYEFYMTWMRIRSYASIEPTIVFGAEDLPPNPDHPPPTTPPPTTPPTTTPPTTTPTTPNNTTQDPIPRSTIILLSVVGPALIILVIGAIIFTMKMEK
jgi:hypothetical protein